VSILNVFDLALSKNCINLFSISLVILGTSINLRDAKRGAPFVPGCVVRRDCVTSP